jgi:hypothetical protein
MAVMTHPLLEIGNRPGFPYDLLRSLFRVRWTRAIKNKAIMIARLATTQKKLISDLLIRDITINANASGTAENIVVVGHRNNSAAKIIPAIATNCSVLNVASL